LNFEEATFFREGLVAVQRGGKWGFIDKRGVQIVRPTFAEAGPFHEGRSRVVRRGKVGFILHKGDYAIEPQFEEGSHFSEGVAAVSLKGKFGYVSAIGRYVIPPKFDSAQPFQEGLAAVRDGTTGRWGFVDKTGNLAIPSEYTAVRGFSSGLAAVKLESGESEKWGYIDKSGEMIIPPRYDGALSFQDGLASVRIEPDPGAGDLVGLGAISEPAVKWAMIDKNGSPIPTAQFQEMGEFSGGLCPVRGDDRWGYIDRTGTLRIDPVFDEARPFHEGRAVVGIRTAGGKMAYGYIDDSGKYVFEPRSRMIEASHFSEGLAAVKIARSWLERLSPFDW
jgi:hypothetical protein